MSGTTSNVISYIQYKYISGTCARSQVGAPGSHRAFILQPGTFGQSIGQSESRLLHPNKFSICSTLFNIVKANEHHNVIACTHAVSFIQLTRSNSLRKSQTQRHDCNYDTLLFLPFNRLIIEQY